MPMKSNIKIERFRPDQWDELVKNAAADEHSGVYCPTHVSMLGGEIVGYLSIAQLPVVLCWQHREKVKPLDSMKLLSFINGALSGVKFHLIPCDPVSPYNTLLEREGYVRYTKPVHLYVNQLEGK
jgi:hypothetical protein